MTKKEIKEYTKNYKCDIKKTDNLQDFLNNFTKEQLLKILENASLLEKIDYPYLEVIKLKNKPKSEAIKVFISNYYGIYSNILKAINENFINEFNYLIFYENNYHQEEFENTYFDYPIGFLNYLNQNLLAGVNFDEKTNLLTIKVPEKIGIFFKKIINNTDFIEKNRGYNLMRERIKILLSPYYVLPLNKLYTFYKKNF